MSHILSYIDRLATCKCIRIKNTKVIQFINQVSKNTIAKTKLNQLAVTIFNCFPPRRHSVVSCPQLLIALTSLSIHLEASTRVPESDIETKQSKGSVDMCVCVSAKLLLNHFSSKTSYCMTPDLMVLKKNRQTDIDSPHRHSHNHLPSHSNSTRCLIICCHTILLFYMLYYTTILDTILYYTLAGLEST